jgi:hypothetical protein
MTLCGRRSRQRAEKPQALHSETALACQIAVSREGPLRATCDGCAKVADRPTAAGEQSLLKAVARCRHQRPGTPLHWCAGYAILDHQGKASDRNLSSDLNNVIGWQVVGIGDVSGVTFHKSE